MASESLADAGGSAPNDDALNLRLGKKKKKSPQIIKSDNKEEGKKIKNSKRLALMS